MMKPNRRLLLACAPALALLGLGAWSAPARAATEQAFTAPAFAAAQREGKPILVEIDASWCPTCAQQRPILARLMTDPEFHNLLIYKVNFDTQKDIVRAMSAKMQSTLVVFHGGAERGRSVGDTNAASIRALLLKAET